MPTSPGVRDCQKAEVTDPHQPLGQDVQQEAPHELLTVQAQGLGSVRVTVPYTGSELGDRPQRVMGTGSGLTYGHSSFCKQKAWP